MLPPPIDDSLDVQEPVVQEQQQYYYEPPIQQQQYYYEQQPRQVVQEQKKTDIFSDLERSHWIILACAMLLAFFMGKSMTPVIIRNT